MSDMPHDATAGSAARPEIMELDTADLRAALAAGWADWRAAPGFDGGRFSPAMDGPTHLFHDWVAGRIGALREAGDA